MTDIHTILIAFINSESLETTNGQIAFTIFKNINKLNDVHLIELATLCNVSNSAITRFCKKIGLDGFFELRYLIKIYHRRDKEKFYIQKEDSKVISHEKYIDLQIEQIKNYKKNIDSSKIFKLSHELYKNKKILIMGSLQSSSSALQLQATLLQLNIITKVITSPNKQREFLEDLNEDYLVIIFSVSGLFLHRLIGKDFIPKKTNSKFILITQNDKMLDYLFYDLIYSTGTTQDYSADHIPFGLTCSLIGLTCYQISNNRL